MHYPWANILLFVLLVTQFVTGYWGMVNGRDTFDWVLWLHGIGAYGLLVLLFWKSDIILHAWRRKSRWTGRRLIYGLTTLLFLQTLFLGLLWTFQGPVYLFGFSLISLHFYAAVPLTLLMALCHPRAPGHRPPPVLECSSHQCRRMVAVACYGLVQIDHGPAWHQATIYGLI